MKEFVTVNAHRDITREIATKLACHALIIAKFAIKMLVNNVIKGTLIMEIHALNAILNVILAATQVLQTVLPANQTLTILMANA